MSVVEIVIKPDHRERSHQAWRIESRYLGPEFG